MASADTFAVPGTGIGAQRPGVGTPLLLLALLAMMVLPLPPLLLDALFTFNISLSLVVLLVAVYTPRPLDFASFPSVLLLATLLRLGLNVASTRVVLLEGHNGSDAAGQVIRAFGEVVVGGSYAVGIAVFTVLVIINFVVVTKGAGRISEVSARFVLDAMPGKQMAIDADLGAGIIDQREARRRRAEVTAEADFYGAMDGASKFVRGDAIAGVLVVLVNIIGGFAIGTLQHGLPLAEAGRHYTLLTIGDGLVAQVPSLLLSTAAALIVTRVSDAHDMGEQILNQLFGTPRALAITAAVLAILGFLPGMPHFAFLTMACGAAAAAYLVALRVRARTPSAPQPPAPALPEESQELGWDDVLPVDPVGVELGYKLVPMADRQRGGRLMQRIKAVRKKLTQEIGFLIPPVHIRDNLTFAPDAYSISIHGSVVGRGSVFPERELAISSGAVVGELRGIETRDPAFGLPAVWIDAADRDNAQTLGYTVVDAPTVIATHVSQVIQAHAAELLGYEDTRELLERLGRGAPKLVDELTPKSLPLSTVHRVLQNLLLEHIPIRDLRTIAECLAEQAARTKDSDALTGAVRVALGRTIVQQVVGAGTELAVVTLDPTLEQLLLQSLQGGAGGGVVEPGLIEKLGGMLADCARRHESLGHPLALLVGPRLRQWLARLTRQAASALHVLSYDELPEGYRVRIIETIGAAAESPRSPQARTP
jgi:flagellar biosynthesis protein FlhA